MIQNSQLSEVRRRLIATYNPKRLILFGSQVWGAPHQDSDLDILIEVEQTTEPVWKRPRKGYKALFGIGIPCDLLVRTSHEIEHECRFPNSFIAKIIIDGQVFHGE